MVVLNKFIICVQGLKSKRKKLTFFFTVCFSINRERSSYVVLAKCQHLKISDVRLASSIMLFPRRFMNLEKFVHRALKRQHKEHASRRKAGSPPSKSISQHMCSSCAVVVVFVVPCSILNE